MNQKTASAPSAENKMGSMPIGRLLFNMSLTDDGFHASAGTL